LRDWLDPLNLNPQAIDGYNPNTPSFALDAAVQSLSGASGYFCNQSEFSPQVVIRNAGADALTSVDITYSLDGSVQGSTTWTGFLSSNQTTTVLLPELNVEESGVYVYSVGLSNPNGMTDQEPANDSASSTFEVAAEAATAQLDLTFDCWANEITWELISDGSGNVVASGGGYPGDSDGQTVSETFCLAAGCYTFTIFDSFGDGLNGSAYAFCGIDGDYAITDQNGNSLVTMTAPGGDFGSSATHSFCIEENTPPCEMPYEQVQNLSSSVQSNGVLLQWDAIPGSVACQIQGGPVDGGSTSINLLQPEASEYFVNQGILQAGQDYEWRVRCACSVNPTIVGPFSVDNVFFWPGNAKSVNLEKHLTLFPNPAGDELNLEFRSLKQGSYRLRISDAWGRIVSEEMTVLPEEGTIRMDVSELTEGVYILEVMNAEVRMVKRFIRR
jgi:hypothetical protein